MNKRLLIIFILGFSSGLPLALIGSTLQAWYASAGLSVLATGALSLVGLPYVYRVFWGPILDRYSLFSIGKRRSWIVTMHVFLLLGFNVMAWLNPLQHPKLMAGIALLLACFSATQDVAIDAHRIEYISPKMHALAASFASFGYRLALLLSGGFALVMAANYGWATTYRLMGFFMLFGLVAILCSSEPSKETTYSFSQSFIAPMKDLIAKPKITYLLLFIFFYKLGEAFTSTMSGIVMPFLIQGLHYSLETIGYMNKMLGVVSLILGGLSAGLILMRYSLYTSLFFFGLLQALTNGLFIIQAIVGKQTTILALAVFADNFAAGMGSTALIALMMRVVNQQFTGTQFSILVAVSALPRVFSGPIAASIQMSLGWVGVYQISVLLALIFIPFLILIKEQTRAYSADPLLV
jgi:PAT family beta-lactamase induction signal transducer AmpG